MSRLTDKARSINFTDEEHSPPSPAADSSERPRTAIGRLSASFAVEAENRTLKQRLEQFEDAKVIEFLDPAKIRASRYANRHELSFASAEFQQLRDEIASAGRNVQPIKVRRLEGAPDGALFEIVFGHRRHRACLELGLRVAAVIEDMSDAQLFVEMDRENRGREDLTPWEQGVMYKRALDEQLFPSIRKLAEQVGASHGAVGMAVQMASLPVEVIQAFPTPLDVQFRWVAPLAQAVERDPKRVASIARELAVESPRPNARQAFERLTSLPESTEQLPAETVDFARAGKRVGRFERDRKGNVRLSLRAGALSAAQEKRLVEFVGKLLD